VLKKAATIAVAASAAVLALSPLAFADTGNGSSSGGLVNPSGNAAAISGQVCSNDFPIEGGVAQGQVPVKDIAAAVTGALSLLSGDAGSSSVTTSTPTITNTRACGAQSTSAGDVNTQGR
jgi:hypothetical protein